MTATQTSLAMTAAERSAFLAEPRTGIVVVARPADAAPLAGPVWYAYTPGGDIVFVTAAHTEKAGLLAAGAAAAFTVHDEAVVPRFVTVDTTATVRPADDATRRRIGIRYLPTEMLDGFIAATPTSGLVTVTLRPVRWRTSDFGKLPGS